MTKGNYRLLTRSDFDGLVCGVLLKHQGVIDDIKFVHPKDMQDGKIEVTDRDILTNLPYVPGCHLCFDHHHSEAVRNAGGDVTNHVLEPEADSAARVVFDHYGGASTFPDICPDMMEAVDKADAAKFTVDDVLNPGGWTLLSFLMDARTGLGRFRNFRVSNYDLMMQLIDACRDHNIDEILQLPDVQERVELYNDHQDKMRQQLIDCSTIHQHLVVVDLRPEETIYAGNRFVIYALFPQCNISMHVIWGLKKQNTVFAMGKSIFNRTSTVDIGNLALKYGGGGHIAAGTCQIDNDRAAQVQQELVNHILTSDQPASTAA